MARTGYVKTEDDFRVEAHCAAQPIDKPVQPILQKLVDLGFKTYFSCAGYSYPGHNITKNGQPKRSAYPYVLFDGDLASVRELSEFVMFGWEVRVNRHYFELTYNHHVGRKNSWKTLLKCLDKFQKRRRSGWIYIDSISIDEWKMHG
jgi:hypothetical protein